MSQKGISNLMDTTASVSCPTCGVNISVYDSSNSIYFGCADCNTFFTNIDGSKSLLISKDLDNSYYPLLVPLGTKCKFNNKHYVLVGFLQKKHISENTYWKEYILYRKNQNGYTVLSEYNGHWILVDAVDKNKYSFHNKAVFGTSWELRQLSPPRHYKYYAGYKCVILAAKGEFDWDVMLDTDKLYTEEFVSDQEMIVVETYDKENFDWYKGVHITDTAIIKAFGIDISDLPPKIGIGVLEPNKYANIWKPFRNFSIFMCLLLIFTQMFFAAIKPPTKVLNETYLVKPDTAAWSTSFSPVKSNSFTIKDDGAVSIDIATDVNNVWLELPVTLVNEKTGEDFEFTKLVEHYTGYEGGEYWSEGSSDVSAVFSSVPAGTYHLNIYPYSETKMEYYIGVSVEANTVLYSNFFLLLGIIVGGLSLQYYLKENIEAKKMS